jgi:hypothetical protein
MNIFSWMGLSQLKNQFMKIVLSTIVPLSIFSCNGRQAENPSEIKVGARNVQVAVHIDIHCPLSSTLAFYGRNKKTPKTIHKVFFLFSQTAKAGVLLFLKQK